MHDPRYGHLAEVLTGHSTKIKTGDRVLVEAFDVPDDMVISLIRAIREAGGVPLVSIKHQRVMRELVRAGDEDAMEAAGAYESHRMAQVQAYMALRGSRNVMEMSDVPGDAMRLYEQRWMKPVHFEIRVPKTRWVVLRWPTPSMAQQAGMSTEAFEDFFFDVCTLDYGKMERALAPLKERMNRTDRVRITGPGTDLSFSIRDIPTVGCSGDRNIPDGECFTAPVRDSVNGVIRFNTPTLYHGVTFTDVELRFEEGRITEATGNRTEKLNEIFDTDEGARYIGEFAIGFNPHITAPMLDILFDEKIAGSFHFTPGQAYEEADNGNRSAVHWDMVMIQTPEYGGGTIEFDGEVIRRDGRFVVPELEDLNPERLK
ncbi:MAG: aminopeptidase [Gemmatimonadetes bacterium]|nr:aminopeptidase [Gemmatimonadota bacterium]MYB60215.1 aminopeptidase [Gemmatimonadota bacterium]